MIITRAPTAHILKYIQNQSLLSTEYIINYKTVIIQLFVFANNKSDIINLLHQNREAKKIFAMLSNDTATSNS